MNRIRKWFKIRKWDEKTVKGYIDLCDAYIEANFGSKKEMIVLRKWCKKRLEKIDKKI